MVETDEFAINWLPPVLAVIALIKNVRSVHLFYSSCSVYHNAISYTVTWKTRWKQRILKSQQVICTCSNDLCSQACSGLHILATKIYGKMEEVGSEGLKINQCDAKVWVQSRNMKQ